MKGFFKILWAIAPFLLFSCTHQEKEIFEDSATQRVDKAIIKDAEILTSATNGWVMQYFPSPQQAYGGYTLLVKFGNDGKVQVAGDIFEADNVQSSLYSLIPSGGSLLSFDTHNPIMHFFSNPRNPNEIGSSGKGMEGDYEFLIMESSAEEVVLEGRKTKNKIVMTPLQAGINWSDYLRGIQESSTTLGNTSDAVITIGDKVLNMEQGLRQFSVSYTENDTLYSKKLPYVVTSKGVKFYDSPTLLGKTLDEFVFSENKKSMTSSDGSMVIEFLFTPIDINGRKWDIIVSASNVSDSFNTVFEEIKTKNIEVYEETLEPLLSLGLYRSSDGEPGISFFSTTSENRTYRSLHGLKFKGVPGYPDNLAVIAGRTDLFNWSFYTHLLPMVTAITDNSPYKTELNNETDPSVVKLTSTKNADFWFILRR